MSRQIDFSKKLSKEDREWLHEWSLDHLIDENDRIFDKEYQSSEGPEIEYNPLNGPGNPRLPADFPNDQVATGPAYPTPDHPSAQQYIKPPQPSGDEVDISELTVDELKDELRKLDQPVSGNKKELEDRLAKALEG